MSSIAMRVLIGFAPLALAMLIHPWALQSWPYDVGFGVVIFGVMHMTSPMQYSLRDALAWLIATVVIWVVSMYVLPRYGLAPSTLLEDTSSHRALRRLPDVVVTTLTFAALASAFAAISPAVADEPQQAS
jgi:hypothetical protein